MSPNAIPKLSALTSIRGIAAWWVVVYHFRTTLPVWLPQGARHIIGDGYLAVDLFFQLSGFVIALNYLERFRSLSWGSIRTFLGLRLARIYPLHFVMMMAYLLNPIAILLFSGHGQPGARYSPGYFVLSLILIQNWGLTDQLAWNVPAWSISCEWLAYLAFPLGAWVLFRLATTRPLAAGATLLFLALLAALTLGTGISLGADIEHFGAIRCLLEFMAGASLQRLWAMSAPQSQWLSSAALAGAAACAAIYWGLQAPDGLIVPLGASLLIYALADANGLAGRLLSSPWLEAIGTISYSTYMVHYFVRDWVKFLLIKSTSDDTISMMIYLCVTAILSVLLYKLVERPGRGFVRRTVLGRFKISFVTT